MACAFNAAFIPSDIYIGAIVVGKKHGGGVRGAMAIAKAYSCVATNHVPTWYARSRLKTSRSFPFAQRQGKFASDAGNVCQCC